MKKQTGYINKKYTITAKEFPYVETAIILREELPSDILDDIADRNIPPRELYYKGVLVTRGKGINATTGFRMDNLRKQLKGFKYFEVV